MSLALVSRRAALLAPWHRNPLWALARAVPSLDLRFADDKSLRDAVSGQQLITFTRASSGTYVDSQGVIRTATTNLLSLSESLASGWGVLRASISSDSAVAPSGATAADKLIEDATATATHYAYRYPTLVANTLYTYSVYLKADGRNFAVIGLNNNLENTGARVAVNLSTGTLGAPYALGTGSSISASISNAGSGWWRVSLSAIIDSSSTAGLCTIYLSNSIITSGVPSYTGDGTSGVLVWGAQLEQSATVGEYIPTGATINSAPRFDHNPITGESLGLLVEEQRTNLLVRSEEFNDAGVWGALNITVPANAQVAPNGTASAETITDVNGVTSANVGCFQTTTLADSTTYAMSCYVKAGTKTSCRVGIRDKSGANIFANFDLATATTTVGNAISSTIQAVGNGWYRCTAICTSATGAVSPRGLVFMDTVGYTADGTGTIHVWGAQLEAGSFPTSYIPTTTAAATRAADVASITGTAFSSWYRQDEGTVFVEARLTRQASVAGTALLGIETGSSNTEAIYMHYRGSGLTAAIMYDNSTLQVDFSPYGSAVAANTTIKQAFGVKLNDSNAAGGGIIGALDANCTLPAPTLMQIGTSSAAGNYLNGTLRRITYWSQRLPDSVLASITQ